MWLPRLFPEGWLSKVTAGAWVHCYLPVVDNGVRRESALSYCPRSIRRTFRLAAIHTRDEQGAT